MEPDLAARALGAATEIATAALSGDDPEAVLALVVRRAADLVVREAVRQVDELARRRCAHRLIDLEAFGIGCDIETAASCHDE